MGLDFAARLVVDSAFLEGLSSGGVRAVDRFVLAQTNQMRRVYQRSGDPTIAQASAIQLLDVIAQIPAAERSLQVARLRGFAANMYIARGASAEDLQRALHQLDLGMSTIGHIQSFSDEMKSAHVSLALFGGVARKALGRFDDAIGFMRDVRRDLIRNDEVNAVDLVPLARQEIIMLQTARGHQQLGVSALAYRDSHPREYYGSIKRVFEYVLNTQRVRDAKRIFPEWRAAYLRVAPLLDPISRVSCLKNVGQFAIELGAYAKAERVLQRSLIEAQQRSLLGQVRQIVTLLARARDGGAGKLVTYTVG